MRLFALSIVVGSLLVGCGQPHSSANSNSDVLTGDFDNGGCQNNTQCTSGVCDTNTGLCSSPDSCTKHAQCGNNQYCHFVNPPSPWVAGSEGECSPPCASSNDCSLGQSCNNGRCYSQIDCIPANNNVDCPPGEVCNDQSHACTVPPAQCAWDDDCPAEWFCNTDDTCLDPEDVDLGGCTTTPDCNSVAGCQNGACTCNAGSCQPVGGCTSYTDCPAGNYCNAGTCRPAEECTASTSGNSCLPFGTSFVCVGGYCVDQPGCANSGCPNGLSCINNTCQDPNGNECARDDQCSAGKYCELFTGTCETGCRSSADCAGRCAGAAVCNCNATHQCGSGGGGVQGSTCGDTDDCGGGMVCTYVDQNTALMCGSFFGDLGAADCDAKECRIVCDLLTNQVVNTCPAGQSCGGSAGGFDQVLTTLISSLIESLMGGGTASASASVCF